MHCRRGNRGIEARIIKRSGGYNIDGRADATRGHIGLATLVHLDPGNTLNRKVTEIKRPAVTTRCGHLTTVQGDQVKGGAKASNRHVLSFPPRPVDRDSGNPLQRLSEVGIGKRTDILRCNGIDNTRVIALDVRRFLKTLAYTRYDHLLHTGSGFAA